MAPTIDVVVMRVVTRFASAAEFVAGFGRYCTDTTCFVPTTERKLPGIETGFSIRLADGTPVLRGLCVVLDSWSASESPFKRAGVNLGIRSITPESREVFEQLQDFRDATRAPSVPIAVMAGNEVAGRALTASTAASTAKPPPTPPPRPSQRIIEDKATVEMAPLFPVEAASAGILPANPLTEMTDSALADFIDCMLYEDPVPAGELECGNTAPVVMVPVSTPSRAVIATTLGIQPLRLTPVYAPLRSPRQPEHTPDELPTVPRSSAPTIRDAPATRDTQQTMQIEAHRRWWSGVSRLLSRALQLVRRPAEPYVRRVAEPRASRRGPRRARTGLAPIAPPPARPPADQ